MKRTVCLLILLALLFTLSVPALAEEASDGNVVVKTWVNTSGNKATGVVTGSSEDFVTIRAMGDATGVITQSHNSATITPYSYDEYQVSDYFYMRVFDGNNNVVSVYKVTLTGMVSKVSSDRRITSVRFSRVSGDVCTTSSSISGYTADAYVTHPSEGTLSAHFRLGSGGSFTVS